MGHTAPSKLADLKDILTEVKSWEFIKQKGIGIFYFRSVPFLHFHDKKGERWAHVKNGMKWETVSLPFRAKRIERKDFLKQVRKYYDQISKIRPTTAKIQKRRS